MELVANDTVHTSFVFVRHVFAENHFVQNLDSQCAHCHRFPSHSTASKRATTTRWRCISATASVIHMRSTACDAPSVVSSVSSLAACGLPCCARMAPQCPSVWVSLVAFFLSLRSSVCGRRQSRLVFGSRSPRCGASLAGPSKKAPRALALAIHRACIDTRACACVCTERHPTWVSYS